ncbi:hypothetical protein HU200_019621 [Digitaria exilis]|uniref:DUF295 domain-containing protein n=1 Tax=Digitaria exilis TaxID=1010633 RepID=A0A835F3K3_9POAL|nr:hypothetical protein HU200_019621 [Digitaria exilis]
MSTRSPCTIRRRRPARGEAHGPAPRHRRRGRHGLLRVHRERAGIPQVRRRRAELQDGRRRHGRHPRRHGVLVELPRRVPRRALPGRRPLRRLEPLQDRRGRRVQDGFSAPAWRKVDTIGDDRVFLLGGDRIGLSSFGASCSASRHGLPSNCIYFLNHLAINENFFHVIIDLRTGTQEVLRPFKQFVDPLRPPFWMLPTEP